eukprot:c19352_g1_i1 orf=262-1140(+)
MVCGRFFRDSSSPPWVIHTLLVGAATVAIGAAAHRAYLLHRHGRSRVLGIIPARYKSSRFEGKPLALISGKPLIQRTWERAKLATTLDSLIVATDDERIAECCRGFGADVVMTSESCENGTERCQEALLKLRAKYDVVVNIQGDEPVFDSDVIDGLVHALQADRTAVLSTAVTSLKLEDAADTKRVKCVVDNHGHAIYFSRGLLPFNKLGQANPNFPYLLHLGIYCYDSKFLMLYPRLNSTPLQLEEDLEQLKVLEHGYTIKVVKVNHEAHAVDIPSDIPKIEALMNGESVS